MPYRMRLANCFRPPKQWIDVVVDIDDTLVYSGGPIDLHPRGSYRLAHGAIEFLAALDRIPLVRTSLYSAGHPVRNKMLLERITSEAKKMNISLHKKVQIFSVADGMHGKKLLSGLRPHLHLGRAILVDDRGGFADFRERGNLLKVYSDDGFAVDDKVYRVRMRNNLVRALGMILGCIRLSDEGKCSVVDCLFRLQWDGEVYLHQNSNSVEVYQEGLKAMKGVNSSFELFQGDDDESVQPWSQPGNEEVFHSNIWDTPV